MKYRFEVRWEDWAEFEVEAENEAEAFEKIADVVYDYEYRDGRLGAYRESAVARPVAVDAAEILLPSAKRLRTSNRQTGVSASFAVDDV